jgi:carboxyl-terminal processing protease
MIRLESQIPSAGASRAVFTRGLLFIVIACCMVGCAVVDPHNFLLRRFEPNVNIAEDEQTHPYRKQALEFVWNTINERYYDPTLNGVDWAGAKLENESAILNAETDAEFWQRLDGLTAKLGDSHTRVTSPESVERSRAGQVLGLGIVFSIIDNELIVRHVVADSDAFAKGIRPGMLVREIDGVETSIAVARLLGESRPGSTELNSRNIALGSLNLGPPGSAIQLGLSRLDGTSLSVTVKRELRLASPAVESRVLEGNIGYIRFSVFANGVDKDVLKAIRSLHATKGLVIDLRDNPGGRSNVATSILSQLYAAPVEGLVRRTRTGKPVKVFFVTTLPLRPVIPGSGPLAYTKPVAILTNERSSSASELFAAQIQDTNRGIVIGQKTCGCALFTIGQAAIPGGGKLSYSEATILRRDGTTIEGKGVRPDVAVSLTRNDLTNGADPVLSAAEELLRRDAVPMKATETVPGDSPFSLFSSPLRDSVPALSSSENGR